MSNSRIEYSRGKLDETCLTLSNFFGQASWYPQFIPANQPKNENKIKVYRHAPEITYTSAQTGWQILNNEINKTIDRSNAQIVIIPHEKDVTANLETELSVRHLTKVNADKAVSSEFPDETFEIRTLKENPAADHVYIVSSGKTPLDFDKIAAVARHFKKDLGKKFVTVVLSSIGPAREDKNVDLNGEYKKNAIVIDSIMASLSANGVDRLIAIEPHSSGVQGYAGGLEKPMPVAPISAWKYLVDNVVREGKIRIGEEEIEVGKDKFVVVRPDKGRNIAAVRMQKYLGLEGVAFNKKRNDQEVYFEELTAEEQEKVRGKYILMFDDEVEGMGTAEGILNKLKNYKAKGVIFLFVHTKLAGNKWQQRMNHNLLLAAYGTDSLVPIGNPELTPKLKIISLEPFIADLLKADLDGTNFWQDPNFCDLILQSNGDKGECE